MARKRPGDEPVAQQEAVVVGLQLQVVAHRDWGDDDALLPGEGLANARNARQKVAADLGVRKGQEAVADLDRKRVDIDEFPDVVLGGRRDRRSGLSWLSLAGRLALGRGALGRGIRQGPVILVRLQRAGEDACKGREPEEREHRHAGHQSEDRHARRRDAYGARVADQLAGDLCPQVVVVRGPRH